MKLDFIQIQTNGFKKYKMKLNKLERLEVALDIICSHCKDTNAEEIIEALIGIAWSEEDGSKLLNFIEQGDKEI